MLVISELSPAVGSIIDSTTIIRAAVRYHVRDTVAYPGPYAVGISFRTSSRGSITPARPEERLNGPEVREYDAASGYAEVSYPVSLVWNNRSIFRPIQVVLSLTSRIAEPAPVTDVSPRVQLRRKADILVQAMVEYRVPPQE